MAEMIPASAASTPPPERLGYQPALDGVRAVAISLVVLFHYPWKARYFWLAPVHGGFLGVDAFFVLSGFLITTLLLQEHITRGRVSFRRFYARRALRLLPALAVLVAIGLILSFRLPPRDANRPQLSGLLSVIFYMANWINIYHHKALGITSDTWSLSIEEQFYVVWPLILIAMLRRHLRMGTIATLTAVGVAASAGWRAWFWYHHVSHVSSSNPYAAFVSAGVRLKTWNRLYFGSDTRADALLVGCLTAVMLFWLLPRLGARARARLSAASYVAAIIAAVMISRATAVLDDWLPYWGMLAFALTIGVLIAGLVVAPRGPIARLFALAPLAWLGRRSYAIYLFHQLVYLYYRRWRIRLSSPFGFIFQMIAILFAAELSYRLVEAPMLRRKHRFEPLAAPAPEPAP